MKSWPAKKGTSQNPGNAFCSFSLKAWKWSHSLFVEYMLFLVTIESDLVECFLCQATAEPVFIILEISMSHKVNPQPTIPCMAVSFLELFKIKGKSLNLESYTPIYETTYKRGGSFSISNVLPGASFYPNSPAPPLSRGPGQAGKKAIKV